ncbi:hypothetical protein KEM54_002856 [Ascosphaera aggregata]|nr:hypothetical protein KEM54_002856 [Ascosphaera aggregata]
MSNDKTPPGHLGNLTPEQEQKFLQLWEMLLKIFSESPRDKHSGTNNASAASTPSTPSTPPGAAPSSSSSLSTATSASKEKKKLRWWGGSRTDLTNHVDQGGFAGLEGDDKWGMNKEFYNALKKHSPLELQEAFYNSCKNEHADVTILRFLRARKWDVNKAFVMLVSTLQFRLDMYQVDSDIMARGEGGSMQDSQSSDPKVKKSGSDFINLLTLGHSFVHRTDKQNRPVCYIRVRMHKIGAYAQSSVERYTIWMIETARLLMAPRIETAAIVFDMTGFGLSNMDYSAVKFIVQCFEANYPESLGVVLVHKAPWIFSSAWSLIKGWLDPVVASKVHFTKEDEELLEFIPKHNLLKELGGENQSEYRYTPVVEGENSIMEDKQTAQALKDERHKLCERFQELTKKWIEINKTGHTKDEILVKERETLGDQIVSSYWDLDPYIRARSVYDRLHFIKRPDEQAAISSSSFSSSSTTTINNDAANGTILTSKIAEKNDVTSSETDAVAEGTQVN